MRGEASLSAHQHKKSERSCTSCACVQVVISSAFESDIGLAHYAQLAAAIDAHASSRGLVPLAHGLGTSHWFAQQPITAQLIGATGSLNTSSNSNMQQPHASFAPATGISIEAAEACLGEARDSLPTSCQSLTVHGHCTCVRTKQGTYTFHALAFQLAGCSPLHGEREQQLEAPWRHDSSLGGLRQCAVLFLHGFLGQADDWRAVVAGISAAGASCWALDLPGHGRSTCHAEPACEGGFFKMTVLLINKLNKLSPSRLSIGYPHQISERNLREMCSQCSPWPCACAK